MRGAILIIIFISLYGLARAQGGIANSYNKGYELYEAENYSVAVNLFKSLEQKCAKDDTLYPYILWYYINTLTQLEKESRLSEKFDRSLEYGREALRLIEKGIRITKDDYQPRYYWMQKNLVVSYFGLDNLKEARKHQDILYKAYRAKKLPEGLDGCYNFSYFIFENKNIWGYEWYPELGDEETHGSFSKIVYYVYSRNEDGSDKDQLYRLHVLKFHKTDDSVPFDYVLTKRVETAANEKGGTLYAYTYLKKIDYVKLRKDIMEVLSGNISTDTGHIIRKN